MVSCKKQSFTLIIDGGSILDSVEVVDELGLVVKAHPKPYQGV